MESCVKLTKQYIDGVWRGGRQDDTIQDLNPYDNLVLLDIKSASLDDFSEAHEVAQRGVPGALPSW